MTRKKSRSSFAARRVDAAFHTFQDEPLAGEDLDRFYVTRHDHADRDLLLDSLRRSIEGLDRSRTPRKTRSKFLVVGLPGCGKSTDLYWLASQLTSDYHLAPKTIVVHYNLAEVMELIDLDIAEVIVSLTIALYEQMAALSIHMGAEPLQEILRWTRDGEDTFEQYEEDTAATTLALLGVLKFEWSAKDGSRYERRGKVRRHIPRLIQMLNDQLDRIESDTGCYLIFIVDQLDKVSPTDAALRLFRENRLHLTNLHCFAIYSAPMSLALDRNFNTISDSFEHIYSLPMFQVHDRHWQVGPDEEQDIAILREIVYRRAVPELFENGVVDEAIQLTGGVLRDLMKIMRGCCARQSRLGGKQITFQALALVKEDMKRRIWLMLDDDDLRELTRLAKSQQRSAATIHHLQSVCALPYPGLWCDIHPLVRDILIDQGLLKA